MKILARISLLALLSASLLSCQQTPKSTPDTQAPAAMEETAPTPPTLWDNHKSDLPVPQEDSTKEKKYSTIQVVNTERFINEVCEIDPAKGYCFKNKIPVIIDFYADWCGPCHQITPALVELAQEYAGRIIIYKVNVDKCPEVASAFKVENIPTLIYQKPNHQPGKTVGSISKAEIEKHILQDLLP